MGPCRYLDKLPFRGVHLFWLGDLFFERKRDRNPLHKTCSSTTIWWAKWGRMDQKTRRTKTKKNKATHSTKNRDKATHPEVSIRID